MVQSETICNIPHDSSRQGTAITPHFLSVFKLARAPLLPCCFFSVSGSEIRQPVAKSFRGQSGEKGDAFQSLIMVKTAYKIAGNIG